MEKKYHQIKFFAGSTIEDAVNELLAHKKSGILACGDFNGHLFYSDTVTMDSAYLAITGKTKDEFDLGILKVKLDRDINEVAHKEKMPELVTEWTKKGKAILKEDKWDIWEQMVPIRLLDLYKGLELGSCLAIITILNNDGTLVEAKNEIDRQGHSGMSFGLVCSMVRDLCERGEEFVEYVR